MARSENPAGLSTGLVRSSSIAAPETANTTTIMLLKVGELAKRAGLTVRTLHHYDAIGLLSPSGRSAAGYRLYARHLPAAVMSRVRPRFLQHYLQWPELLAQARELHERQADPASPGVQDLASRWIALFEAVWGDDPALHRQVLSINDSEPELIDSMELGLNQGALDLVRKGIAHLRQQFAGGT